MNQLQFQFFWPLTEQIPLDLDYTDCARPQLTYPTSLNSSQGFTFIGNGGVGAVSITSSHLTIDSETTTIKVKNKPNIIRRGLFNALGLKWELK